MFFSRLRVVFALILSLGGLAVHAGEAVRPSPAPKSEPVPSGAAQAQESQAPKCNADCVRANMERASQSCARRIESEAPIDFEWISRPFAGIFAEADPSSGTNSVVLYRGDALRFLNPQKEWIRVAYQCAYDAAERRVLDVRIRPGRLNSAQSDQSRAGSSSRPGEAQAPQRIESAKLAEAIQHAAQQRQSQVKAAAPGPKVAPIGEVSEIEILQVSPKGRP